MSINLSVEHRQRNERNMTTGAIQILLISQCLYFGLVHCSPFQYDFYHDGSVSESDWTSDSDSDDDSKSISAVSQEAARLHSLLKRDLTDSTVNNESYTEETIVKGIEVVEVDEGKGNSSPPAKPEGGIFGQNLLNLLSPLNFFINKDLEKVKPHEIIVNNQTVEKATTSTTEASKMTEKSSEEEEKENEKTTTELVEVTTVEEIQKRQVNETSGTTSAPKESSSSLTTEESTTTEKSEESSEESETETPKVPKEHVIATPDPMIQAKLNKDIPGGAVITDEIVQKIQEIQAPPVILTQGL